MKYIKKSYSYFISPIIVSIFFVFFMIGHRVAPFGNNSMVNYDCFNQFYPFLCVYYDKIKSGETLYYYWNSGLGGNFLNNYFSHLISPFNLIVFFFKRENIHVFINFLIFIKSVFASITFAFYLTKKTTKSANQLLITAFSVAYSLSGYVCCYYHEIMWFEAYILLPIIMYGYDVLINEGKPYIYTISLGICAICNVYPVYFIAIFLILNFLISKYCSIKDFMIKGIRFAVASILSIGLAAVVLVGSFLNLGNTYVSSEGLPVHFWYGNFFELFRYQFMFSNPVTITFDLGKANLYCGTFVILLFILFFFIKEIDLFHKVKYGVLVLFLYVSMNENILNYFWHGFHIQTGAPNRFSFLLIFLLLSISYVVLTEITKNDSTRIIPGLIIAEFLPMISYFFCDFDSAIISRQILVISLVLILIYSVLVLIHINVKKGKGLIILLFSIMMILEVLLNGGYEITNTIGNFNTYFNNYAIVHKLYTDVSDENELCRSEYIESGIANANAICGLNGVGIFSSSYSYDSYKHLLLLGQASFVNYIESQEQAEPFEDIIGLKYAFVDVDNDVYQSRSNYKKVAEESGIIAYENKNALPISFCVDDDVASYEYGTNEKVFSNLNNIITCMGGEGIFHNEIYPEFYINPENCSIEMIDADYLTFNCLSNPEDDRKITIGFTIPYNGEYNLSFRDDNYYSLKIYKNDEIYYSRSSHTIIMSYLGECKEGDKIEIIIQNDEGIQDGINYVDSDIVELHIAKQNPEVMKSFVEKSKKSGISISEYKSDYIRGRYDVKDGQVIFTSIPYDDNWHVYENGIEINKEKYFGMFIGLDVGSGVHEIEFRYVPYGLHSGIAITLISVITLLLYAYFSRKFKQSKSDENEKEISN